MKIIKEISKTIAVVVISSLVVVAVTFAQTWNSAPSSPPSNNAPAPINVSNTSQSKAGNFTANVIGANGFCLGSSCITAWPTSGGVSASDVKIVETPEVVNPAIGTASCGSGYKVMGGGFVRTGETVSTGVSDRPWSSHPSSDSAWSVDYKNGKFKVYAVCLKVQ